MALCFFLPMGDFTLKVSLFEEIVGDTALHFYIMFITGSLIPLFLAEKNLFPLLFYSGIVSLVRQEADDYNKLNVGLMARLKHVFQLCFLCFQKKLDWSVNGRFKHVISAYTETW